MIDKHLENSRMLDRNGIDRIDYWIKCLHDNGIYVWLDMHSYRQFRDGDRQTELGTHRHLSTSSPTSGSRHQVKGYCQYDPVVQKLMTEFQEKYLNHVNRYTNLAYKDDPTIAFALITNENDITHHYGILAFPAKSIRNSTGSAGSGSSSLPKRPASTKTRCGCPGRRDRPACS